MDKSFRLIVGFLTIGTAVLTIAAAYVVGAEQGVNSQQPTIVELFRKLNPDVLINPLPYMHPLRNVLFGSALSIGICWIALLIAMFLKTKKEKRFWTHISILE